jgi:hypothetical protein
MSSLNGTLPDLQAAYSQLAAIASAHGLTIGIADFGGLRSETDTTTILGYRQADYNAAVRAGSISADTTLQQFRPIAPFGNSYHNYGAAFDVSILSRPSSQSESSALAMLGQYAPALGLRWGGNFSDPDYPHFELDLSLSDAQAEYDAMTGGSSDTGAGPLANSSSWLVLIGAAIVAGYLAWRHETTRRIA